MRKFLWISLIILVLGTGLTVINLSPIPNSLYLFDAPVKKAQILDRHGIPLSITYQNDWNIHDIVPLHDIPDFLQQVFILAEDKRFYEHNGMDWQARWHAVWQNILALRLVRGASTLTEQTVRILHPRPRSFWSRWLEGFEAARLENKFSKADILEFYLNQVPYARQRRGVVQAARLYFDRDLSTLNLKEMMALAVLVRSPGRLDLRQGTKKIEKPIAQLLKRLLQLGLVTPTDYQNILTTPLQLHDAKLPVQATHFVNHIYATQTVNTVRSNLKRLHTTLDSNIQSKVQKILDQRVQDLHHKNVNNGAVLVVDHQKQEVLAWVNAGQNSHIDSVLTKRQPGSSLKPFLYAAALEKGWTAATIINDAPLASEVGMGLHQYRNYSGGYYGRLRLRDTLGNSLNTPAIRTIQFVGVSQFLQYLHHLGFASLTEHPEYYGEGLALGNGGVTLFELVQAYTTLANQGNFQVLNILSHAQKFEPKRVYSSEVTSIIANILSDHNARQLEFGRSALLHFPVQTAVKTGTSTDYRDAWTVGFNYRYTVGVWLGNLDQQPMSRVSGGSGAALIVRTVFAELNRYEKTYPLYESPKLIKINICRTTGMRATPDCPSKLEWFIKDKLPQHRRVKKTHLYLKHPTPNLHLAMDPRIPDEYEAFTFMLSDTVLEDAHAIEWWVDGVLMDTTLPDNRQFLWAVTRGPHTAQVKVLFNKDKIQQVTPIVKFLVK